MKKFDWQKALNGEPVITAMGQPVKIINNPDALYCDMIVGVLDGHLSFWNMNGKKFKNGHSTMDIYMAEQKTNKL